MHFDVHAHTILLAVTGSHAYGTARPESDLDIRGCCVAPPEIRLSFHRRFEQYTHPGGPAPKTPVWAEARAALARHPTAHDGLGEDTTLDLVIYDVAKLVGLCADANPNMLELLFLDPQDVIYAAPAWERLRAARGMFLSRKAKYTYSGYAHSQLRRIRGHRAWLLDPPKQPPTRADFGLPEETVLSADDRNRIDEAVAKIIRGWSVEDMELPAAERDVLRDRMRDFWATCLQCQVDEIDERTYQLAAQSVGLTGDVLHALKQERAYRSARKHWEQFRKWQRERNPARAALEARHGYDTKHGMHLIRLMRTGLEILRDGALQVRRPDAAELAAIRDGLYSYDQLLAEAERLEAEMEAALTTTKLPRAANLMAIDALLQDIVLERIRGAS
ncbi:MAG: nucleotidyltransferase domain-containing protein [Myxococcales bacterium]|nr:nucleotidyltransferase domain-containing protein [Myxococcales bacterium]